MLIGVMSLVIFGLTFGLMLGVCPVKPFGSLEIAPLGGITHMDKMGQISCLQMVLCGLL